MSGLTEEEKLSRIEKIYTLYDRVMSRFNVRCKKRCAACCTCNVTLTGLEAAFLLAALPDGRKRAAIEDVQAGFPERRYQPELTANMFARRCMAGEEIPEEENDPSWGRCPLLKDDTCTVYNGRPFGCRALMSQVACHETGEAQVPPLALTFQNIFMQAIEQLDAGGVFGNLSDILLFTAERKIPAGDGQGGKKRLRADANRFPENETIKILMVPPEHREQTAHVIRLLSEILK